MEKQQPNSMHGLKWGLIISVVYVIFIFLRYKLGATNPILFATFAFVGYVVVLILLLLTGTSRKKALGGYIELKDAFQTMFVAVVIFEFVYALFNFLYLKYIDPNFFVTFKSSTAEFLAKSGMNQGDIDKKLQDLDVNAAQKWNGSNLIFEYITWLAISGIIALVFALIIRKRKNPFQDQNILQQ